MASDRDDRRAAATALASLQRLADLGPALVLPAHGPLPAHPDAALQAAFRRAKRLVDDPDGAVWYGARRVFAYALMIYDGIPRRRPRPVPARPRLVHRCRPAAPPLPRRPGQRTRPLHDKQQRHRHHRRQGPRCRTAHPRGPANPQHSLSKGLDVTLSGNG